MINLYETGPFLRLTAKRQLRGHMMGDNRVRFTDAAENIIARARRSRVSSQMQLI